MSGSGRALLVYESMFGNTEKVARAIGEGLRSRLEVDVVRVDQAPAVLPADLALVVVGGPTHAFSMSRTSTRVSASTQGATVMPLETGIREWLDGLRQDDEPPQVASFDTRISKVRRLPGSAAKAAAKVLRRRGFKAIVGRESFFVDDTVGPLSSGELERARQWGIQLAAQLRPASASDVAEKRSS